MEHHLAHLGTATRALAAASAAAQQPAAAEAELGSAGNWPDIWSMERKEHWKTLIKARSIENQLFMVCSNRTGTEGDLIFPGMSMIVDPMGNVLTEAANNEKIAFADIDPGLVKKARTLIPCSTDRRQEIYG